MRSAATMHPQYHEEVSKIMSKILRHKAVKYGIMGADDSAWVSVDDLARAGRLMGCEQDLIEVARTSEKQGKPWFEVRVQGNGCFVRSTRKHTGLQLKAMYGGRDRASEVHLAGPLQASSASARRSAQESGSSDDGNICFPPARGM
jgi:RNA:NAD 2'-phosphotransferase (TPT1/KptA family)